MKSLVNYESTTDEEYSDDEKVLSTTSKKRRLSVEETIKKKQTVPKLPSFFSPVLQSKESDRKDYQGRLRGTPAVVNSWATHIYIQFPLNDEIQSILNTIPQNSNIHTYDEKDLHISLSKCFLLKEHELDSFAKSIKSQLSHINSFSISFAQLTKFENENKTRFFLSAEIGYGYNEINKCVERIDQTAIKYKQPPYYKPPRFHLSFAWSLKSDPIEEALDNISKKQIEDLIYVQYNIHTIYIKMGNRIVNIELN
ncbi:hypothetical protein BJ944DRAFT_271154 [Cunninghamella echinulata]|nr:hypothetical protein BJ944DRAFT_271154 [Cunninghamella echinulata]